MNVLAAMGYGAVGGCMIGFVALFADVTDWQAACRERKREDQPPLRDYVLPGPDGIVLVLRALLGAAAGCAFHSQVTGVAAAIAVGAAAPGLFRQLGTVRGVQEAVQGTDLAAATETSGTTAAPLVPQVPELATNGAVIGSVPSQTVLPSQSPHPVTAANPPQAVGSQEGSAEDGP